MAYTVYKHTAPNGKIYIGITGRKPKTRWQNGAAYKNNKHFANAIAKYGWENFSHEIISEGLSKEEAESAEIALIAKFRSNQEEFGYNIAAGGKSNSGYRHSDKTKEKIANSLRGRKHTAERREHQRAAQMNTWKNEDHRKHMSEVHKGKMIGADNPASIRVFQYDLDGKLLNVFQSMGQAERKTGIRHQIISECCSGKVKTAKGYIWKKQCIDHK